MSSNTAQILALMEGMTAEQLTALQEQAKKQKKTAKNKKQLLKEEQMKEIKRVWHGICWGDREGINEMTNDERIRMLCECYGMKVAHKRTTGRHKERTMGDTATNKSNGQNSWIVCRTEESFKYAIMGIDCSGKKIWEGKGKNKKYTGKCHFSLQKTLPPLFHQLSKDNKKKIFGEKFTQEWWKVGDNPSDVDAPTERTNSKAFMLWWDENVERGASAGWKFKGEYNMENNFLEFAQEAIESIEEASTATPAEPVTVENSSNGGNKKKTVENSSNGGNKKKTVKKPTKKKTKKNNKKELKKMMMEGATPAECREKYPQLAEKTFKKYPHFEESLGMMAEDVNVAEPEEDLSIFTDDLFCLTDDDSC
jgi:hypothetical protein